MKKQIRELITNALTSSKRVYHSKPPVLPRVVEIGIPQRAAKLPIKENVIAVLTRTERK